MMDNEWENMLKELLGKYSKNIMNILYSEYKNSYSYADIEDAFFEAVTIMYEKNTKGSLKKIQLSSTISFLTNTARNTLNTRKEKENRRFKIFTGIKNLFPYTKTKETSIELDKYLPELYGEIFKSEKQRKLYAAIKMLPEKHQKLIYLKLYGYSYKEIASILGYSSAKVVEETYRRCIKKIRNIING